MAKPKEQEPVKVGRKARAGESTSMIGIRVTDSEREAYEAAAAGTPRPGKPGETMTLAEWIRHCCARIMRRKKG